MVSTVHKTTDGQVFESRKEASAHQNILNAVDRFEEIFTYASQGEGVLDKEVLQQKLTDGSIKIKFIDE